MEADLRRTNDNADQNESEMALMPDMGALTTITGTIHKMGMS